MKIAFLYPGAARFKRLLTAKSEPIPHEFFYGYTGLVQNNYDVKLLDSRKSPDDFLRKLHLTYEIIRNRLTTSGFSRQRVYANIEDTRDIDLAVSFADWFSLSIGRYRKLLKKDMKVIGGFHGLSDIPNHFHPSIRGFYIKKIRKSLDNIDHLFFFGEADRKRAIELFNIEPKKTSLILFGVDLDFWKPGGDEEDYIFSVGSDRNRDYETLLKAGVSNKIRIVTKLPINKSLITDNVELLAGSYHNSAISDVVLREFYQKSKIVVVPVKDVYQPSGYSVTLQAMACGKPVILSKIKGLWDSDLYKNGKNCLLVEPGNPQAIKQAIEKLQDEKFRLGIAEAALQTARTHFSIDRMNDSIRAIVDTYGR